MQLGPGPEFDLIRRFVAGGVELVPGVRVGPGDDCAVVVAPGGLALSSDMSVEGTHFRREWLAPEEIGWRAATAALSDLAAVAARPIGVLASLALPASDVGTWAERLMEGIRAAAAAVGAAVIGGDLTRTAGGAVVDCTVIGECAEPVLRSGAGPGDEVWVTGDLGGAAAAVRAWLGGAAPDEAARARFARPEARTAEARWLRERGVLRAMLDLSDGLAGDAAHLAAASGVAVVIDTESLPRHAAATTADALHGGEDFELCFAAQPGRVVSLLAEWDARFPVALTRVGVVRAGHGVWTAVPGREPVPLARGGYQHFVGTE